MAAALADTDLGVVVKEIRDRLHAVSVVVPETDEGWLQVLPPVVPPPARTAAVQTDDSYYPFPVTLTLDTDTPLPVRLQVPTLGYASTPQGYVTGPIQYQDASVRYPLVTTALTMAKAAEMPYMLQSTNFTIQADDEEVTIFRTTASVPSSSGIAPDVNWPTDAHAVD